MHPMFKLLICRDMENICNVREKPMKKCKIPGLMETDCNLFCVEIKFTPVCNVHAKLYIMWG